MTYHPAPLETLFLWRLLVNEGGEFLKSVKPDPGAPARRRLEQAGLIQCTKRRRPTPKGRGRRVQYIELTEAGWGWAAEHLDAKISERSQAAGAILHAVLRKLNKHLSSCPTSLADFITETAPIVDESAPAQPDADGGNPNVHGAATRSPRAGARTDLASMICDICREIRSTNRSGSVRLAALRQRLSNVPAERVDQTLLKLERDQQIALYPIENPRELDADDANAALPNSAGFDRHILYLMEN